MTNQPNKNRQIKKRGKTAAAIPAKAVKVVANGVKKN
jgi:hypothetical protein